MKQFRALYSLILRTQTTRARVLMLGALGLLGIIIAIPLRSADDPLEAGMHFIDNFGLTLVVPITTLVFASAALGDFIDDGTMVYLWLRPVRRFKLALAAAAVSAPSALAGAPQVTECRYTEILGLLNDPCSAVCGPGVTADRLFSVIVIRTTP